MTYKKAPPFTVIKDTREQDGYTFLKEKTSGFECLGMINKKLDTGDYSLLGFEDKICIERKASVPELATNLGKDKFRFLEEIKRMKCFPHKFIILEFSLEDVLNFPNGSGIPEEHIDSIKVSNKYMLKMLMELQLYDNIHVLFCGNRKSAKFATTSILKRINEMYTIGRKM
jgi:ERCC4-type nuclease